MDTDGKIKFNDKFHQISLGRVWNFRGNAAAQNDVVD